jgi:hypothetical protein
LIAHWQWDDLQADLNADTVPRGADGPPHRKANMTRKDYTLIAEAIASVPPRDFTEAKFQTRIVQALTDALEADSIRFDPQRFQSACYSE